VPESVAALGTALGLISPPGFWLALIALLLVWFVGKPVAAQVKSLS